MVSHPNRRKALEMNTGDHVRQGDTLLVKVESVPSKAKEFPRDENGAIVLAYGEKTGHMHRFTQKNICSLSTLDDNEIEYLLVNGGGATLRHELVNGSKAEHNPITVPDGSYESAIQVEYTPAELVRVTD